MVREAFSDDTVVEGLSLFVPVLVDGDLPEHKATMSEYGVRSYPTVKFLDSAGKQISDMRGRAPGAVRGQLDRIIKSNPPRISKEYKKVFKARLTLEKTMAKKKVNHKKAIDAIGKIQSAKHRGRDYKYAARIKAQFIAEAKGKMEEAKGLLESKPAKAKSMYKAIAKTYKGLKVADEAKAAAEAI